VRNQGGGKNKMAQKTILAVAIGDANVDLPGINAYPPPARVRPYINGLINQLPGIGADPGYIVNYYERPESQLDALFDAQHSPDVVFCMSVRVVQHAQPKYPATKLIVGVVSDHGPYNGTNVTGYSADRVVGAVYGYDAFWLTAPDRTAVYVLHHSGHAPSVNALAKIRAKYPAHDPRAPNVVHVEEALGTTITAQLNGAAIPGTAGVFVLPIDRCFGARQEIIDWQNANHVPTFWPVTDWVDTSATGAFAGYGVPQALCGARMGDKIQTYWAAGAIPPWEDCNPATDFKWIASGNTAAALGVGLGSLQII
jgi:hypothetical protein